MMVMLMVVAMIIILLTCMIELRMMVGPGKVDGEHVARDPVVEKPEQDRLTSLSGVLVMMMIMMTMMVMTMMMINDQSIHLVARVRKISCKGARMFSRSRCWSPWIDYEISRS